MEKGFTIQCNVCGETVTINEDSKNLKITVGCYYDHEINFRCKNCSQQIVI